MIAMILRSHSIRNLYYKKGCENGCKFSVFQTTQLSFPTKLRKKHVRLVLTFYRKLFSISSFSQAFCPDSLAYGNNQELKATAYVEWLYHPINHIYCHVLTCCFNFRKFNDSSWILQNLKKRKGKERKSHDFTLNTKGMFVHFHVYWEVTRYSQI